MYFYADNIIPLPANPSKKMPRKQKNFIEVDMNKIKKVHIEDVISMFQCLEGGSGVYKRN